MKNLLLFFVLFLLGSHSLLAQFCQEGESHIVLIVHTDQFPQENSFTLFNSDTSYFDVDLAPPAYSPNTEYTFETCVAEGTCLSFSFEDSFGDGLAGQGFFTLSIDGVVVLDDPFFQYQVNEEFNCSPGMTCNTAMEVEEGLYAVLGHDFWYAFTPDSVGTYLISTCEGNTCDTKIWVYDTCDGLITSTNEGTVFYDDNEGGCGLQAQINGIFQVGTTYYIRIGDAGNDCENMVINWSLMYNGPIEGCTDPTSCNYNPIATVDDGSCLELGDPNCPDAPDLVLRQDVLISSLELSTINADASDCFIEENCLQGFGVRDIIRFSTHIENIGELDYFIGDPTNNPDQFSLGNCHGHAHYDGYAEYLLFDENGNQLPIGVKNGFCVLDWQCDGGGTPKYGCSYMGISAGCEDIYDSNLDCQWVDVTAVPDGPYILVTRVNWDNAPDAAGRVEKETDNNWAQVCVILDRTSGELTMTVDPVCETYVDCEGTLYGPVTEDCMGECGGTVLMGDLNANEVQEMIDAEIYVVDMLGNDIQPTPCNDLNADNLITIYDAALLSDCINFGAGHTHTGGGTHSHCNFPDGVVNIYDTVALSIVDVNVTDQYIDIAMLNNSSNVVAYQFNLSGVVLTTVENLVDPAVYPISPSANFTGMVAGISYQDSVILKSASPQALCRVYYQDLIGNEICIESIIDIVDHKYQQTRTRIDGSCWILSSTGEVTRSIQVDVQPNPFNDQTRLTFDAAQADAFQLELVDITGKVIRTYDDIRNGELIIKRDELSAGIYFYRLRAGDFSTIGKLSIF